MSDQLNAAAAVSVDRSMLAQNEFVKQQQATLEELRSMVNSLVQDAESRRKEVEELKSIVKERAGTQVRSRSHSNNSSIRRKGRSSSLSSSYVDVGAQFLPANIPLGWREDDKIPQYQRYIPIGDSADSRHRGQQSSISSSRTTDIDLRAKSESRSRSTDVKGLGEKSRSPEGRESSRRSRSHLEDLGGQKLRGQHNLNRQMRWWKKVKTFNNAVVRLVLPRRPRQTRFSLTLPPVPKPIPPTDPQNIVSGHVKY